MNVASLPEDELFGAIVSILTTLIFNEWFQALQLQQRNTLDNPQTPFEGKIILIYFKPL